MSEETTRFIYGTRSLDTWDDYTATLYSTYGLQQYIDMGVSTLQEAGIL